MLSAGPGPPVMNGILEVCHWTWASFLTKSCRRPLHLLSVFCPRASGLESLKCFLFYGPSAAWGKSALRCQSVHAGTLLKTFWKVASLGVLISLSPAVFFLWLYYTTALHFRLFADRTRLLCNICAYSGLICTYRKWYNEYVERVYGWIDKR